MALKLPKIDLDFLKQKKRPLHVAIDGSNLIGWTKKNGKEEKDAAIRNVEQLTRFVNYQIKSDIPIITLNISAETEDEIVELVKFFKELETNESIQKHKVRIFVIGRWFDMEQRLTSSFKKLMEDTAEYDNLFLNFCVKYDGQEEVLGVINLLARKAMLGKINLDELNKDMIKENLYSSYFTPPEIIIEPSKIYSGLLLWDAKGAKIFQTRKHWLDLTTADIDDAITWANRE
ncbi:undecaprenyl diphosphate synthase family protein [archaeon]|nr:undecaprenyl diphosphate synthase family protein [archaeon]MBL7057114.1 undecaprenyl diphosphate synthase family protein [Candidatus Woesearchaeota archaeon]